MARSPHRSRDGLALPRRPPRGGRRWAGASSLGADGDPHRGPALQRSVLVRERAQVQAVPQAPRGSRRSRTRSAPCAACRPSIARPPYAETGIPPRWNEPAVKSPELIERMRRAGALAAEVLTPGRRAGGARRDDRRDRRLRPRPHHRARRLPQPAQLQRLPEERLHVGQRGHLPRHPRRPGAAGRRHRQPRRHRLPRRRARRHQRHVLRRRRRRREPPPGPGDRGVHVAGHRRGRARAARSTRSAAPSRTTPRSTTSASSGRSSATASASSSTPTCRSTTTTSPGHAPSCGRA